MYGWGKLPSSEIVLFIENVASSLDIGDTEKKGIVKKVEEFIKKRDKSGIKFKRDEDDLPVLPRTKDEFLTKLKRYKPIL